MTIKNCLAAALAFAAGLLLLALVKRPCPPSPRHETPSLDTDADASGDRYGEYYR